MTEELRTKDQLTLDNLKRSIERVGDRPSLRADMSTSEHYALLSEWNRRRFQAAMTAFNWHVGLIKRHADLSEQVGAHLADWVAIDREEEEGIRLVREKLS